METNEIFVERLKELIKEKTDSGISLNAIAKEIGINQPTLFRYKNGEREPGIVNLAKIAKYFNESTDWLLGLKGYEEK